MNSHHLLELAMMFFRQYTLLAVVLAAAVALFALARPKEFGKLLLVVGFLAAVLYVLSLIGGTMETGIKEKDQMIYKTQNALER